MQEASKLHYHDEDGRFDPRLRMLCKAFQGLHNTGYRRFKEDDPHCRAYDLTLYGFIPKGETRPTRIILRLTPSAGENDYLSAQDMEAEDADVWMASLDYRAIPFEQLVRACKKAYCEVPFQPRDRCAQFKQFNPETDEFDDVTVAEFFSADPEEDGPGGRIYLRDKAFFCSAKPRPTKADFAAVQRMTCRRRADLTEIDLSQADVRGRKDLSRLFAGCRSMKRLDMSHFDFSGAESLHDMFAGCVGLEEVILSDTILEAGRVPSITYFWTDLSTGFLEIPGWKPLTKSWKDGLTVSQVYYAGKNDVVIKNGGRMFEVCDDSFQAQPRDMSVCYLGENTGDDALAGRMKGEDVPLMVTSADLYYASTRACLNDLPFGWVTEMEALLYLGLRAPNTCNCRTKLTIVPHRVLESEKKALVNEAAPAQEEETEQPAPESEEPAPEPEQPAPEPEQPAPEPEQPAPEPEQPAPEPEQPAPESEEPAPEPGEPAPQKSESPKAAVPEQSKKPQAYTTRMDDWTYESLLSSGKDKRAPVHQQPFDPKLRVPNTSRRKEDPSMRMYTEGWVYWGLLFFGFFILLEIYFVFFA